MEPSKPSAERELTTRTVWADELIPLGCTEAALAEDTDTRSPQAGLAIRPSGRRDRREFDDTVEIKKLLRLKNTFQISTDF